MNITITIMDNILFKSFICFVLIIGVWSIDEESIKELSCLKEPPNPAKDVNLTWLISVPVWYYYFASKLDFYRTSTDLTRTPISKLNEEENSNACMTVKWADTFTMSGFGDKKAEFQLKREDDGIYSFTTELLQLGGLTLLIHLIASDA